MILKATMTMDVLTKISPTVYVFHSVGGVMGDIMITVSVALESVVTVVDVVISLALKNVRGINCANQVDISSQIMCLASMCK